MQIVCYTVLPPYKWSRNNLVANSFRDKEDMRFKLDQSERGKRHVSKETP
jgi:hypothetical protein